MRAVVIFESMYGNTHQIARAIGSGLGAGDVAVVPVNRIDDALLETADLIVVGGPTHVHGMSRPKTRAAAVEATHKAGNTLTMDPTADGAGVREWLTSRYGTGSRQLAAAFDTRLHRPACFTGRASKGIARALRHDGFPLVAPPRSFMVTKEGKLDTGEEERAREWGAQLARAVAATPRTTAATA